MAYQAFPIADPKTGLYEAKQPWLSPNDAFTSVNNFYTYQGVYKKRKGYSEFTQMNHYQKAITGVTQADPGVVTSASHGLSNGTTVLIYGVSGMTELNGNTYTVANAATNTFELSGTDTTGFTAYTSGGKIATYQTNAITGIHEYIKSDGNRELLVFDTKRVAKYNTSTTELQDLVEADTFTGDNEDFFWLDNWKGNSYFVNGVDRLYEYDGSTVAALDVDIDGDASNELNTCLMVMPFKERLCLLGTKEDGTWYPQRLRYSKVADPDVWDDTIANGGGYVDAPTGQWIKGARYNKDYIIVYFDKSVWVIRYTGNVDLPFRWEKVADFQNDSMEFGSRFSTINIGSEVWTFGSTGFVGSNGFSVNQINGSVPEITLKANQNKRNLITSGKLDNLRQIWVSYPGMSSETSDNVMVFNYTEGSWTLYDLDVTVFGYYRLQSALTWDDVGDSWDAISETWDKYGEQVQQGYPFLLGGSQTGYVWRMSNTSKDNGTNVSGNIYSSRWNPYVKQGQKAKLGWIDFLVTSNESTTCTVDLYVDFDSSSYQTSTLSFSTPNNESKVWVRLNSGAVAESHRIKISNSDATSPEIHAIVPYFEPAGHII